MTKRNKYGFKIEIFGQVKKITYVHKASRANV